MTETIASVADDLRARVRGPVLTPGDPGYDDTTQLWNGLIKKAPALVVRPTGTADVVAAVNFARDNGIPISVKGGGHNVAGIALVDEGLTIDLSSLRGVTVDPVARTATVLAGCQLGEVDREAQLYGLATPLGFISEVGVAGLTLGGGLGYLTRRFGWTVDNLLEVEIVTADGRVQRASRDENADLFWAVRGAGANFGVVTRFVFRLHEVGPMVYGGLIAWPFEQADQILRGYQRLTVEAPRELTVFLEMFSAPPAPVIPAEWHGKKICAATICYSGDMSKVDEVMAPVHALGEPIAAMLGEQPYAQVQSNLDAFEPTGHHNYWKTEFHSELSVGLLDAIRDAAAECQAPEALVGFLHIGGALNDRDWNDGAVGNRDARYVSGVNAIWAPDDPNGDQYIQWVRDSWARTRKFSTGATYINFQSVDEGPERVQATYGPNFDRLVEIKAKYDPANMFRSNRNIPLD
jgi:FAD/FMN-containing dehydrogenase